MSTPITDLSSLRQEVRGFWSARTILTAVELDLFSAVSPEGSSALDIAERTGLSLRGVEIILKALHSLGLLHADGARYRNSDLAARVLVKSSPYYRGGTFLHSSTLWERWSRLTDIVRSGRPVATPMSLASLASDVCE